MKDKTFTVADRMLIRTMIVSVSVAAVLALGTPAQASLRSASAHATHSAALVTTIRATTPTAGGCLHPTLVSSLISSIH
jgi:hypothetical protein